MWNKQKFQLSKEQKVEKRSTVYDVLEFIIKGSSKQVGFSLSALEPLYNDNRYLM